LGLKGIFCLKYTINLLAKQGDYYFKEGKICVTNVAGHICYIDVKCFALEC
jgi:hypothetical protein